MEPLGATASVITILQLSSDVVKYIIGSKGASKVRRRLREEIIACESILLQLQDYVDDGETKWWEKIKAIEGQNTPLYRLGVTLNIIKTKLEPKRGLAEALSVAKWPFNEKDVDRLISAVQREKSLLQLTLTTDCRYERLSRVRKTSLG